MSEAMKFKREIKAVTGLDPQMLDTAEDGYVLTLERSLVNKASYTLLAEFAAQNQLNLQLEIGRYIISTNALRPAPESHRVF
jgi:hypothetical protein